MITSHSTTDHQSRSRIASSVMTLLLHSLLLSWNTHEVRGAVIAESKCKLHFSFALSSSNSTTSTSTTATRVSSAFPALLPPSTSSSSTSSPSSDTVSLQWIYQLEQETSDYLWQHMDARNNTIATTTTSISPLSSSMLSSGEIPLKLIVNFEQYDDSSHGSPAVSSSEGASLLSSSATPLQYLEGLVSLIYQSKNGELPVQIDKILANAVTRDADQQRGNFHNGSLATTASTPLLDSMTVKYFNFEAVSNDSVVLQTISTSDFEELPTASRDEPERGLIIATILLSVMLLVLSWILLCFNGRWRLLRRKLCCHCCYGNVLSKSAQELDAKNSFGVPTADEDDDDDDDEHKHNGDQGPTEDAVSVVSSSVQSSTMNFQATPGILGAASFDREDRVLPDILKLYGHNKIDGGYMSHPANINPTHGMGIKSPGNRSELESYFDEEEDRTQGDDLESQVDMTPMSSTMEDVAPGSAEGGAGALPLGITSMRKLPPLDSPQNHSRFVPGGLAHLVLQRFHSATTQAK